MGKPFDWKALIQLVAPAIGELSAPGSHGHFMQGYMAADQQAQDEKRQQALHAEKLAQGGADFLMRVGDHANTFTDPVDFQNFVALAEDAGVKAGYVKPGEIGSKIRFSQSKQTELRLKELTDQLGGLEHAGYNLDELAQSGSHLELKDGKQIPIATALELTRKRPMDASGKVVQPPPKADEGAQFNDVVNVWKLAHPGQEPPPDVRLALRERAKQGFGKSLQSESFLLDGKPVKGTFDPGTGKYAYNGQDVTGRARPIPPGGAFGTGGTSALDTEGIEYAATQYRVTGVMPALGMGNGSARASIINRAAKQAKELGQSPAVAIQRQATYKADGKALAKMQSMSSAAEAFETKALQQADIVAGLSNKVSRTQWPIINSALLAGQREIVGDKNTQLLFNAISTFTTEYAKIMEGSTGSVAASSESARKAAERLISAKLNQDTLQATLELMKREMSLTVQGYDAAIDHITRRMGGTVPDVPSSVVPPPKAGVGAPSYQDYLAAKGVKK